MCKNKIYSLITINNCQLRCKKYALIVIFVKKLLKMWKIKHYDILDSTNNALIKEIKNNNIEGGHVITAKSQTAGKGLGINKWFSDENKNLLFSLLIKPRRINPTRQFVISKIISLSISSVINKITGLKTKIKWPNDIYIYNKKIGGILIENAIKGKNIDYSIIGVGINTNTTEFPDWIVNPGSLASMTGKTYNNNKLLNDFLSCFDKKYNKELFDETTINKEYLENLYLLNKYAEFKDSSGLFKGMIKGVDEIGRLIIEKKDKKTQNYYFKEVEFIIL